MRAKFTEAGHRPLALAELLVKRFLDALVIRLHGAAPLLVTPQLLHHFRWLSWESIRFALIDLRDLELSFINLQFMEQEAVPTDATIVKHTWAKSNADGSPDRRFKNNFQIPVCQYGRIDLKTTSGLNESYMFSNFEKTRSFANTLHHYLQLSKN